VLGDNSDKTTDIFWEKKVKREYQYSSKDTTTAAFDADHKAKFQTATNMNMKVKSKGNPFKFF
jgi:hypothetical protein